VHILVTCNSYLTNFVGFKSWKSKKMEDMEDEDKYRDMPRLSPQIYDIPPESTPANERYFGSKSSE
jgi:hypothetical protein